MKCPYCLSTENFVVDSRRTSGGSSIWRRRECCDCSNRFTTYELSNLSHLKVLKKNKTKEPYDREKLRRAILRSFIKHKTSPEVIEKILRDVESEIISRAKDKNTITTREIGKSVLAKLKKVDEATYVRFLSVYEKFSDIKDFKERLEK